MQNKMYSISKKELFTISNLMFIFYIISHLLEIIFFEGIVVGCIALFIPGLGWTLLLQSKMRDNVMILVVSVFVTCLFGIAGLLLFALLPIEINQWFFVVYLILITNIGIGILKKDTSFTISQYHVLIWFIVVPVLTFNAFIMPRIYDADAVYTSSAYGIIHELTPYSNLWQPVIELQHPPGTNFISSFSIFLMGHIDDVKDHYVQAKQSEQLTTKTNKDPQYKNTHIVLPHNRELLFATRVPFIYISALLLLILFEIVSRETRSLWYGFFSVLLALVPELFVRFSYADYTPANLLMLLAMCYVYLYVTPYRMIAFVLGFCTAWINQKNVIVPLAVLATDFVRMKGRLTLDSFMLLFGFFVGVITFCIYGTVLEWETFYATFIVDHGVPGLILYSDISGFLTAWTRAILFFNPIVFILSVIAIMYMTVKTFRSKLFIIPAWFYIGTLIFVTCRWPHMKNCCFVYLPLIIALCCFIRNQHKIVRGILMTVVILLYCINFICLSHTFEQPNPFYAFNDGTRSPRDAYLCYSYDAMDKIFHRN